MPSGKISKSNVDALNAEGGKVAFLWDTELKGFGCKSTPGGRKVYLVQYRLGGRAGRAQRVTLGAHGALTADEARRKAKLVLGQIADGTDVAGEIRKQKHVTRTAPTITDAATDFLKMAKAKRKRSTFDEYERLIENLITPGLGNRLVRDVVKGDVKRWHAAHSATPTQANRALAVLSTIFNSAIDDGYVPTRVNPCSGVEHFREEPRRRYLSDKEIGRLGEALRQAETVGVPWKVDESAPSAKHLARPEKRLTRIDPYAAAAIRLYLLTGARLSEILELEWSFVDLEARLLRLPDSKTGKKTIALNPPACAVLDALPRTGRYVIPGEAPDTHRTDLKRPWNMVRRLAGLADVRIHDLRHTVGAVAVASNLSLRIIGGLLGHASEKTSARYGHLSENPVRDAADKVGARISEALGDAPKSQVDNVVMQMPKRFGA